MLLNDNDSNGNGGSTSSGNRAMMAALVPVIEATAVTNTTANCWCH